MAVIFVGAILARPAIASPAEFVFTQNKVVSLRVIGASLAPMEKFDRTAILSRFKGYTLEPAVEEGAPVWYLFVDRNAGDAAGGISIYPGAAGNVETIIGGRDSIDANGAGVGDAITAAIKAPNATCSYQLNAECQSDTWPTISYILNVAACGTRVTFGEDSAATKLDPCMKIYAISLSAP